MSGSPKMTKRLPFASVFEVAVQVVATTSEWSQRNCPWPLPLKKDVSLFCISLFFILHNRRIVAEGMFETMKECKRTVGFAASGRFFFIRNFPRVYVLLWSKYIQ